MLKQYHVLNKCLSDLKTSSLPAMEKLKLEVELIQTKRILLDHEVERRVAGVVDSENDFNDLYHMVRHASASDDSKEWLNKVISQLQKIRNSFKLDMPSLPKTNPNPIQRYLIENILKNGTF
jgi:hypothetical protein